MQKLTLRDAQLAAEAKGGKCLATEYSGAGVKMQFECAKGHHWLGTLHKIKRNHWCPHCSKFKRHTIEMMQQLAAKMGGECLSVVYLGNGVKHKWKCAKGHEFESKPNNIIQLGNWCSSCSMYKTESLVRSVFEDIFKKPFIKVRPNWFKWETGFNLELDGYNEELALAFEYNGVFHYKTLPNIQNNLRETLRRDRWKISRTKELEIKLIVVGEILQPTPKKVEDAVWKELYRAGMNSDLTWGISSDDEMSFRSSRYRFWSQHQSV